METITIFKQMNNTITEPHDEIVLTEWMDDEEDVTYDAPVDFAHYMWNNLMSEKFGDDYYYCPDYFDYTSTFNTNKYKGEGIYQDGNLVIGVDELKSGISEIKLGNVKYYI